MLKHGEIFISWITPLLPVEAGRYVFGKFFSPPRDNFTEFSWFGTKSLRIDFVIILIRHRFWKVFLQAWSWKESALRHFRKAACTLDDISLFAVLQTLLKIRTFGYFSPLLPLSLPICPLPPSDLSSSFRDNFWILFIFLKLISHKPKDHFICCAMYPFVEEMWWWDSYGLFVCGKKLRLTVSDLKFL